ncbi:hypothetical protein SCA6_019197 [Theobroma cacao]
MVEFVGCQPWIFVVVVVAGTAFVFHSDPKSALSRANDRFLFVWLSSLRAQESVSIYELSVIER